MKDVKISALSLLKDWFQKAEKWQKDLFCQLWQGNEDVDKLISRAFSLAKSEYLNEKSKFVPSTEFPTGIEFLGSDSSPVILESISNVQGVGALSPTKPLEFCNNLTIVYGENGCGKSSYVRILKSAVSPKNSEAILSNVYEKNAPSPQATLTYSDDGEKHNINWHPNLNVSCPLNIYDSSIAKRFAEEKNEVIYEPQMLSLLSIMAKVYDGVKIKFEELEKNNFECQTVLNDAISSQDFIVSFLELKTIREYDRFIEKIVWSDKQQSELSVLQEVLQENDPSKQVKMLNAQKELIERQYKSLFDFISKTGKSASDKYLTQRKLQINTKIEADRLIEDVKKVSDLNKTGSEKWKTMWDSAVQFARETDSRVTNNIAVDGKCVLCQQSLAHETVTRIDTFSEYMTSTAMKNAEKAYDDFQKTVNEFKEVYSKINVEQIEISLKSISISDEIISFIISQYNAIISRCKWLFDYNDDTQTNIPEAPDIKLLQEKKDITISEYLAKIKSLNEIISDRDKQVSKKNVLLGLKWVYENKDVRKRDIQIKNGISNCKTNALTTLKKGLTQILITETYVERFNYEMKTMDHNHKIKVELVSDAKKGKAYHYVALKDAVQKKKTGDVLSEGEFRVVSLAAFLADLSSWNKILPFVFDDPITSLDHKYEKMVADRLIKLSTERQVIVFTHRLAFSQLLVSSIDAYNKAQSKSDQIICKQIELRNRPLGEPSEPTYRSNFDMIPALNNLKNKDIARVKKMLKNGDYIGYDQGVKSLCSDFRKIVEQGIETNLLSGIVKRFRYSVETLKLKYLYIVTPNDIDKFNDMMTKYSVYEHSQSIERPLELPEISDIEKDVDDLIALCDDLNKRRKVVDNKK